MLDNKLLKDIKIHENWDLEIGNTMIGQPNEFIDIDDKVLKVKYVEKGGHFLGFIYWKNIAKVGNNLFIDDPNGETIFILRLSEKIMVF